MPQLAELSFFTCLKLPRKLLSLSSRARQQTSYHIRGDTIYDPWYLVFHFLSKMSFPSPSSFTNMQCPPGAKRRRKMPPLKFENGAIFPYCAHTHFLLAKQLLTKSRKLTFVWFILFEELRTFSYFSQNGSMKRRNRGLSNHNVLGEFLSPFSCRVFAGKAWAGGSRDFLCK